MDTMDGKFTAKSSTDYYENIPTNVELCLCIFPLTRADIVCWNNNNNVLLYTYRTINYKNKKNNNNKQQQQRKQKQNMSNMTVQRK